MKGRVVSTKMNKTAVVLVTTTKTHPLYKKSFISSKKYLADDQLNVTIGQIVEMVSVAPISKNKTWKIVKVVGRDIEAVVTEQLKEEAAEMISEVMPEEKVSEGEEVSKVSNGEEIEEQTTEESKQKKTARKAKK